MKTQNIDELKAKARKYAERFFKYDAILDKVEAGPFNGAAWVEAKESRQRAADAWESAVSEVKAAQRRLREIEWTKLKKTGTREEKNAFLAGVA